MLKLAFLMMCIPAVASAEKSFTGDKEGTWDCGKDPEVSISTTNASFTVTGECKSISVTGNSIKLAIESVGELVLNGNRNTAATSKLGTVTINGNNNRASWKIAASGKKPSVHTNGKGNGVAKAK